MVKKTTLWLFLCFLFIGHNVLAVPAVPWPIEKTQPDGSKIMVYLRGDEKVHWMESLDGYTLMYDAQKYLVYAELDANKNMVPSKDRFSSVSKAPSGITKGIRYSSSQISMLKQIGEIYVEYSNTDNNLLRSVKDNVPYRVICALVESENVPLSMSPEDAQEQFDQLMNQPGYTYNSWAKGSVRDYYLENSYGKLDLEVKVVGPYMLPKELTWYGENGVDGYLRDNIYRVAEMGIKTFELVLEDFAENSVNPAYYSNNGDGVIEAFHIIFAGYGEEAGGDPNCIWSKAISGGLYSENGIKLNKFSCSPELQWNLAYNSGPNPAITNIGVICHELGHVFGSPDYYDTDYGDSGGDYPGAGEWDLMAGGSWNGSGNYLAQGAQPAHVNMFQKTLFNWVTPVELTSYTEISDMLNSAQNGVAYTIKANTNGEMYVLENRQKIGFDGSIPGHGLLIWHVHQGALSGNVSNRSHPQQMYPVVANSTTAIPNATVSSYGTVNSDGTPFPGTANKQSFTATTIPAMFTWENLQAIAKPITDITENTSTNTISFKFMAGPTTPVTNLQAAAVDGNVTLTWTAADHPDVLGYKIYRNNILQYTINSKATVTYTQIGVTNGAYTYGVSAFYSASESAPATASVTVTGGPGKYRFPVENLQGDPASTTAQLNWAAPSDKSGPMTIAGGSDINGYTLKNSPAVAFAGTQWGPDQLKGLDGYEITHFGFIPYETAATYEIQIWEIVNSQFYPRETYEYKGSKGAFYTNYPLPAPYLVDASKTYVIGVCVQGGDRIIITDDNPALPGRNWAIDLSNGIVYSFDGANNIYTSIYLNSGNSSSSPSPTVVLNNQTQEVVVIDKPNSPEFLAQPLPVNISPLTIEKAISVEPAGPQYAAPQVTNYFIYRNGVKIGETTSTSFTDKGLNPGTTYSYCVSAVYSNGDASEGACVELTTLPLNEIWWVGITPDWDNENNWLPKVIPDENSRVIIGAVSLFPELTDDVTVAEIHFEPGAKIGGQSYIKGKAYVSYDFRDDLITSLSKRNRWLMLATPLEEVYPGDFTFGGLPYTWVRTFQQSKNENITNGIWATSQKADKSFKPGDGFVIWLDDDSYSTYPLNRGLKKLDGIHEIPFFEHFANPLLRDFYEEVNPFHEYNSGKSTFYNFLNSNSWLKESEDDYYEVGRSLDAFQLAGDINKVLDFLPNEQAGGDVTLIGNPYMAALNFKALHTVNSTIIKPVYHIWRDYGGGQGSYVTYAPDGTAGEQGKDYDEIIQYIAPLQGFLVEKADESGSSPAPAFRVAAEQPSIQFKEATMAVANIPPPNSNSPGKNNINNKLDIVARTPAASIRTFIAKREGGQAVFGNHDALKIMNGISSMPEVYTLKPYTDGVIAASVNIINTDDVLIPVGLATNYQGNITLSFTGMDAYDAKLYLLDTETKKEIDLTGLASYDYVVNYTPKRVNGSVVACEDRFFIRISKTATGLEAIAAEKVNVFAANGKIQVISSATNPLVEVSVYNLQGALLYKETSVAQISHTINRNLPAGVYVVKVVSEQGIDNVKIVTGDE